MRAAARSNPPHRVLGIFAKWPEPGQVKTRLGAETSASFAVRVAEAFLTDTLERMSRVDDHRMLAYAPRQRAADFERLADGRYELVPQGDGDLGQRMANFFSDCFHGGVMSVILIGTDSPTIPVEYVETAFSLLETAQVVLGPAMDGGYYLVGGTAPMPPIFDGIAWSQADVLERTVARIPRSAKLALLPPWYDVDTLSDWRMFRGHVAAMKAAGVDPRVPNIERLMANDEF